MARPPLISLSGPPASGKTTLWQELRKAFPAAAFFDDLPRVALETLGMDLEREDLAAFQHYVGFSLLVREESPACGAPVARFFDKSLLDAVAYWRALIGGPPPPWAKALTPRRYRLVLVCEALPMELSTDPLQIEHESYRDSISAAIGELASAADRVVTLRGSRGERLSTAMRALAEAGGFGMIDRQAAEAMVRRFDEPGDPVAMKSRNLALALFAHTAAPFSDRQFAPGHITCSAVVIAPEGERVLLVHHRRFNRWLLPGGHVEAHDEHLWDAARREVTEETGAVLVPILSSTLTGVDVHGIPPAASEPYHLHFDLVFHFRACSEELRPSPEVFAAAWKWPAELRDLYVPDDIRRACGRAIGAPE